MFNGRSRKNGKIDPKTLESFHFYTSILFLALITGLSASLFWRLTALHMDFYNNLWAPAYLLAHHQDPYHTAVLQPSLPALWFPMAVGFFFPLGRLSEEVATKVWFIINIVELFIVLLLILQERFKFYEIVIIGFLVFLFPPLLNHIVLGQLSITVMCCLMLSAYFAGKRKDWLAAFFLALGLAKPQLAILALPGISFYYFHLGRTKSVFQFGMKTMFMAFLMSLPLFITYPHWTQAWITSLRSNYTWLHPSLFSLLKQTIGLWGYFLWGVTALIGLVICYQLWRKLPPLPAMLWSLGLTTVITPYVWSWDFVLLIPVWMFTFSQVDWKRKTLLIGTYLVGWIGFAFVQRLPDSSNNMFWWFPMWFLSAAALVTLWKTQHRNPIAPLSAPNPRL